MPRYFSGNGDSGESSLFDGRKLPKDDPVFELLGSLDQLSAQIGLAISLTNQKEIKNSLRMPQSLISKIMSLVGGAKIPDLDLAKEISWVEGVITIYEGRFETKHDFKVFGDSVPGAAVNLCRTQTRTVERIALAFSRNNLYISKELIIYLNRLSTFFFVVSLILDQEKSENKL